MSRAEAGVPRAIGEVTQQLEKHVQAAVPGAVATSMQQTHAVLVVTVRGDLHAQIETSRHEMQRRQEEVRGETKKRSEDFELLTTRLNSANW